MIRTFRIKYVQARGYFFIYIYDLVDISGFVDFLYIVVYNLLVYVLMEFRGHTNNNLH